MRAIGQNLEAVADVWHVAVGEQEIQRAVEGGYPTDIELIKLGARRQSADVDRDRARGSLCVVAGDRENAGRACTADENLAGIGYVGVHRARAGKGSFLDGDDSVK